MTTRVLDLATMARALRELSAVYLGGTTWSSHTDEQAIFLMWCEAHAEEISQLADVKSLASTDYNVLNSFLRQNGQKPAFDPFDGVGVVSILDMLVEWLVKGKPVAIRRQEKSADGLLTGTIAMYPAFRLGGCVEAFDVIGWKEPLFCIETKTGHKMWLTKAAEPASGIELAITAQMVLSSRRLPNLAWNRAVIPMLEIDEEPDLDWMLGVDTDSPSDGYHRIVQAFQRFKLHANEVGAHIVATTGFATERSVGPEPYQFDDPFILFFTQRECPRTAIAAAYADIDCWRNSGGTLQSV